MRVCPLPDLQLEGFFVTIRSFLLTNLDNIKASHELVYFLSTLSLHCFTNEYVYHEKDEETQLISKLEEKISKHQGIKAARGHRAFVSRLLSPTVPV